MQNEITELRNQVRTLKRIFCFVFCLFVFAMIGGCQSLPTMELPPLVEAVAPLSLLFSTGGNEQTEMSGEWDRNTPLHSYD